MLHRNRLSIALFAALAATAASACGPDFPNELTADRARTLAHLPEAAFAVEVARLMPTTDARWIPMESGDYWDPVAALQAYLQSFGAGDNLDFVHRCCLLRCHAALSGNDHRWRTQIGIEKVVSNLEAYRSADGGFNVIPGSASGTPTLRARWQFRRQLVRVCCCRCWTSGPRLRVGQVRPSVKAQRSRFGARSVRPERTCRSVRGGPSPRFRCSRARRLTPPVFGI